MQRSRYARSAFISEHRPLHPTSQHAHDTSRRTHTSRRARPADHSPTRPSLARREVLPSADVATRPARHDHSSTTRITHASSRRIPGLSPPPTHRSLHVSLPRVVQVSTAAHAARSTVRVRAAAHAHPCALPHAHLPSIDDRVTSRTRSSSLPFPSTFQACRGRCPRRRRQSRPSFGRRHFDRP